MKDKLFKEDFDIMSCLITVDGNSEYGWHKMVFAIPFNMWWNPDTIDRSKYTYAIEQEVGLPYRKFTIEKNYAFKDHLDV